MPHTFVYAGILPYSTVGGELRLLLGKEQHIPGWNGSKKWSPFGGGVEDGESGQEAALREGGGGTLGLWGTPSELARHPGIDLHRPWKHRNKGYTLLMEIPYDANIPRYFRNFYKYSKKCEGIPEGWLEKTQIQWVPWKKLRKKNLRPEFLRTLPSLKNYLERTSRL